ncbi:hypothetical protein, partial [Mycobacterium sp.]|uniref:hypothetical protein n=1 Tax=Mycobacterium sp. TaxID=1785 RepID=UPI003D6A72DD
MRPERSWPLAAGVFRWTGTSRGGRVGGPELPCLPCVVLVWRASLAGGVPAAVLCPLRGPAGRRLIAKPR